MQENQTNNSTASLTVQPLAPARPGSLMRRLRQPLRRGVEGQALVEFALSLPFLVLLFVVLVETGFLLRSHMTVTAAAREGVRIASGRGNADPSYIFNRNNANEVAHRVGADSDTVLVQNVNTALESERANVTMLMSYRADPTEGNAITHTNSTAPGPINTIGVYGLGGAYGVYYNTAVSKYPFFEVFTYMTKTATSGAVEKWFSPTVMSITDCYNAYKDNPSQVMVNQSNAAGQTYTNTLGNSAYFCGDATKQDYTNKSSGGINRNLRLGQYDPNQPTGVNDNFDSINGKTQFPGAGTNDVCTRTPSSGAPNKNEVIPVKIGVVPTPPLLRCWRYNFAPWYPSLRRSSDIISVPTTDNSDNLDYYNSNREDPQHFGKDDSNSRSPDYTGVRIDYQHKSFLQYLPFNLGLSDKAVKIMDPVGGGFEN